MDDKDRLENVHLPLLVNDGIIFARSSTKCLEAITLSHLGVTTMSSHYQSVLAPMRLSSLPARQVDSGGPFDGLGRQYGRQLGPGHDLSVQSS